MKTSFPKPAEPKWFVIDASTVTLGRLAARTATVLRGKHKATFVPHLISGDHVIIVNAEKIKLTGSKMEKKEYFRHTGYFGHSKQIPVKSMIEKKPEQVILLAVKGMLPKNSLRDRFLSRLHVYTGGEHKHEANNPDTLSLS